MKTRQQYRLEWLEKSLKIIKRREELLDRLDVLGGTTDEKITATQAAISELRNK